MNWVTVLVGGIAVLHFAGYALITRLLLKVRRRRHQKGVPEKPPAPLLRRVRRTRVLAHLCLVVAAATEISVVVAVHAPQAVPAPVVA